MGSPVGPKGRGLKHASAAVQFLLRTKAINSKLRLAPACFRSRRDAIDLFRGSPVPERSITVLAHDVMTTAHCSFDEVARYCPDAKLQTAVF
jgi:hypothetical protein